MVLGRRLQPPPVFLAGTRSSEVVFRSSRLVPWIGGLLSRMGSSAAAVTLRRTVVVHPDVLITPGLIAHELAHVRQWEEDPLFPIRYATATLRFGYLNNPYEVEARRFAASATSDHSADETQDERWIDPS